MATPARLTRSRTNAPLPATNTGVANSFGSRGTANIDNQIEGAQGDFAHGFGARARPARGLSAAQQSRESSAERPQASPKKKPARKSAKQPVIEEESEREPSASPSEARPGSQQGTAIDQVAGYENGLRNFNRNRDRQPTPPANNGNNDDADIIQPAPPSNLYIAFCAILKAFWQLLQAIGHSPLSLLLIFLAIASSLFFGLDHLPVKSIEQHRDRMIRGARVIVGMSEWQKPPAGIEKEWIFFREWRQFRPNELPHHNVPEFQWTVNVNLVSRMEKLEQQHEAMSNAISDVNTNFGDLLPRALVVDVHNGNRLKLTQEFYDAFIHQLQGDWHLWLEFARSNEEVMDRILKVQQKDWVDEAVKTKRIVTGETALEMIQSEFAKLDELFEKRTEEKFAEFIEGLRGYVETAVEDALAKHKGGELPGGNELAKSYYIENTLNELHKFNFFSPESGARIDHRYTSPTAITKQPNLLASLARWLLVPMNPPETALRPFLSFAHSWCASPNTGGEAQLGVWTKQGVVPTAFVIEHIPASGTLDISRAPREVELWMDVKSREVAEEVAGKIESESTRIKVQGACRSSPGETFVCVGRGMYDIHHDNWVQTFPLFRDMSDLPSSDHYVVKVDSNWGGQQTCLYRVKLHGQAA